MTTERSLVTSEPAPLIQFLVEVCQTDQEHWDEGDCPDSSESEWCYQFLDDDEIDPICLQLVETGNPDTVLASWGMRRTTSWQEDSLGFHCYAVGPRLTED